MHRLNLLMRWLKFGGTPGDVAVAQFRAVSRQVPFLYLVMALGAVVTAAIYFESMPLYLTLGVVAVVVPFCLARAIVWLRWSDLPDIAPELALRRLRSGVLTAGLLGAIEGAWKITLASYGDHQMLPLITVLLATSEIGCIFCLMYLPQAAVVVAPAVSVPYIVFLASGRQWLLTGAMIEVALLAALLLWLLNRNFQTFVSLVRSRSALQEGRCEAERLGSDNARLAYTDSLTGLPNRRFFFAQLDATVASRTESAERFAVALLDLDRFKPINDNYGHSVGDRLLAEVGARLLAISDDQMVIARLGGDEFGVLILDGQADAVALGQSLCDLVSRPVQVDDARMAVGCSCGMAIFPDAGGSSRELFDRCDYALYHGKSSQRGSCTLFSAEHALDIRSGQVIEAALQTADIDVEMDLHFQPIIDTHAMTVVAVEALARWNSPVLGRVPPDRFIPVAEGLGMVGLLTRALFGKALEHAVQLPPGVRLSFNLSALDIGTPDTVQALIDLIALSGFPHNRITLEITETAVMTDFDVAVAAIERLRALGIGVALDDFGTGFSSLTHLRRLPLDCVKVDRSFVAALDDPSGHKIVSAIAGLCRNLGLAYVIEGIETTEQLLRVRQFGYRLVQGYLFATPMPMPECVAWIETWTSDAERTEQRRIA
ncbi:putative bifunctional diguanylate cyclase/phosphodiesterase [Sphingomonas sp.]|jgi:diguanylate cyclase (GGDEF)-like protein|uniref:putative bifunctional diguanylate cyclase/phosphodiesterase n=1 Tax=Sphingomonas sp. TaxID=28214 RepID=UPI002ED9F611